MIHPEPDTRIAALAAELTAAKHYSTRLEKERDAQDATAEAARMALATVEAELATMREALMMINTIRNSIIGVQGFNFSEHAYPLVAALNEAGFKGMDYPEAKANIGTLPRALSDALADMTRQRDAAVAESECLQKIHLNVGDKETLAEAIRQRDEARALLKRWRHCDFCPHVSGALTDVTDAFLAATEPKETTR